LSRCASPRTIGADEVIEKEVAESNDRPPKAWRKLGILIEGRLSRTNGELI
jgi:hypothetical protein